MNDAVLPEGRAWEKDTIEFHPLEHVESDVETQTLIYSPDEYISRRDIREGFKSLVNSSECSEKLATAIGAVIEFLPATKNVAPLIDAQWLEENVSREKKWLFFKKKLKNVRGYRCSYCGIHRRVPLNYCPNCGAKCQKEEA